MRALARLRGVTTGLWWYLSLVVVVPTLSLVLAGLWWLWQSGQLLAVLVGWLAITLLGYAAFLLSPGRVARARVTPIDPDDWPDDLPARRDWSAREREAWQRARSAIDERLAEAPAWERMPTLALDTLASVAGDYHGPDTDATYRFTLPEILLVLSVASARYRTAIIDHVPYVDRIRIDSVLAMVRRQEQIRSGLTWANRVRRAARLVNPVGAMVGEVRDAFTDRLFGEVSQSAQTALKRLLLQEVAQTGIDLYSGRLRVSDAELADYLSRAGRADDSRRAEPVEPLRVVLVGQISAGKSSLANALLDTLASEMDRLPATDRLEVHRLAMDGEEALRLVDSPGLDASGARQAALAQTVLEADLVLWVVRATQPARAPDRELMARLDARYRDEPARRRAPVLLVMSHADALSPKAEWTPPYDLGAESGKGATIRAALVSIRDQLGLPIETPSIPVCLSAARGRYNVDEVAAQIRLLAEAAGGTQLNRRRLDRGDEQRGLNARWQQLVRFGRALGRMAVREGTR